MPLGGEGDDILSVEGLTIEALAGGHLFRPVEQVAFRLARGETLGVVGESGSGKTLTMLGLLGLLPSGPRWQVQGRARFGGRDLLSLGARQLRKVRGSEIALVVQNPVASLNPAFRVGWQLSEAMRVHPERAMLPRHERKAHALDLLTRVQLSDPLHRYHQYPHEMSGGMAQRVVIAMALMNRPALLVADEPTTGLDVTVQAQIMDLLRELKDKAGISMILISHNLALVAEIADRVMVMYAGRVVETGPVAELFSRPRHPYTAGLLESIPPMDRRLDRLQPIPGQPASADYRVPGCQFRPRCPLAAEQCEVEPSLMTVDGDDRHVAACHRWTQVGG